MNEVNFLNSLSEQKYISYYRWTKISGFIFFCLFISITIVHIHKLYKITLLRKEKRVIEERLINFDDFVKEKSNIKEYRAEVQKQLNKVYKISSASQRTIIFNFLTNLIKILPDDLCLQNFEFDSKIGVILKGYSSAVHTINDFIQKLSHFTFVEDAKLEYLKFKEDKKEVEQEQRSIAHEFFIKIKIKKEN